MKQTQTAKRACVLADNASANQSKTIDKGTHTAFVMFDFNLVKTASQKKTETQTVHCPHQHKRCIYRRRLGICADCLSDSIFAAELRGKGYSARKAVEDK